VVPSGVDDNLTDRDDSWLDVLAWLVWVTDDLLQTVDMKREVARWAGDVIEAIKKAGE